MPSSSATKTPDWLAIRSIVGLTKSDPITILLGSPFKNALGLAVKNASIDCQTVNSGGQSFAAKLQSVSPVRTTWELTSAWFSKPKDSSSVSAENSLSTPSSLPFIENSSDIESSSLASTAAAEITEVRKRGRLAKRKALNDILPATMFVSLLGK